MPAALHAFMHVGQTALCPSNINVAPSTSKSAACSAMTSACPGWSHTSLHK
ncbi:hypothetical protein Pfeifenkraut_BL30064 [Xanthomonas phage Pfeifenkraut]|uniref:Uncharacterized protein n=1 Tax=Xanthomonas phage Pfeifenkraut TaxID=2939132 RepID=A0A9E7E1Q5_9CAUD|nr:hypothetical protein QAY91_gp64 [Xanthomonas phage Pfeifenkraut]URA06961.1 hypothetical protein Pfeifenkraut_BL30064 [Xanthomonas phage Pfeifenkraut]